MSLFDNRLNMIKLAIDDCEDWSEKYAHIIEFGKKAVDTPHVRQEPYRLKACQSAAWLHLFTDKDVLHMEADSEALIVKGLLKILVFLIDQTPRSEWRHIDLKKLSILGFEEHLTPSRVNGFHQACSYVMSFIEHVRSSPPSAYLETQWS